ncbi:hypothetical protein BVRB_023350 [Beta vulgaris subsp. vulgaris]|uniref:Uncharacterized protein n=1 Tax=Beta vulgaris subsp. vulgaris TaxID=3555 RepID=A0A0J8DTX3_BETVV|nr:hypothetical protein BVRB_023350 [Beta vulgaris subsp. vulgaris]
MLGADLSQLLGNKNSAGTWTDFIPSPSSDLSVSICLPVMNVIERNLYGGAMSVSVPSLCADIGQFRQVPDNQEVFADANSDQSVIVEINEVLPTADAQCASASESTILEQGEMHTCQGEIAYFVNGRQRITKFRDTESQANLVDIWLFVIRLREHEADVVLTLNSPLTIAPHSSSSHCLPTDSARNRELASHIISSFKINNLRLLFS